MPDAPLTLAFDTSAAHCAAALLSGDRVLAARIEPMTKGQAERLLVLCEELLAEVNPGHIFVAGDLSDPHGTHRMCYKAIREAVSTYGGSRGDGEQKEEETKEGRHGHSRG